MDLHQLNENEAQGSIDDLNEGGGGKGDHFVSGELNEAGGGQGGHFGSGEIISQENMLEEDSSSSTTHRCHKIINDIQSFLPTSRPHVSDYLEQIIQGIEQMINKGYGYLADGDAFFAVYADQKLEYATDGAQISLKLIKHHPADFLLWKSAKAGEPNWYSPWGPGRPGWPIACSAMTPHLPFEFDIHAGSSDSISPNQTEIAAPSSADQNGLVTIDDKRMSESSLTTRWITQYYHPLALRYFLLSARFTSSIKFTVSHLESASTAMYSIYETLQDCEDALSSLTGGAEESSTAVTITTAQNDSIELKKQFETQMTDDLDISHIMNDAFQGALDLLKKTLNVLKEQQPASFHCLLETVKEVKAVLDILGLLPSLPYSQVLQQLKDTTLKREQLSKDGAISRKLDRADLEECNSKCTSSVDVRKGGKLDLSCTSDVGKDIVPSNLSDIPEWIIVDILSLLSVKDAALISFTCKAWENLWTYSTNLTFVNRTCPYANHDVGLKIREREKYVGWVRYALKKYKGTKLDRFHIFFDLDSSYKRDIEDWVDFALEHDVKTLILEMVSPFDPSRSNYSFTKRITGESLQVLVLENVDLDGEVFQYISHFRGLEQLSVTGASGLNHIRMFGSSVRLKSLVVRNCWNLEIIEICDLPQLAFFEFEGRPICLDLNSVPNLVKVSLGEDDLEFLKVAFKQLACCLCQLRTLTLDNTLSFLTQENVVFPIPQLPELVCLELRISPDDACVLLQLACFLDASPRLQKLVLKGRG
ncbi:cysteine--tRNA ligase 2, cytoplasmic [Rosa sericea]